MAGKNAVATEPEDKTAPDADTRKRHGNDAVRDRIADALIALMVEGSEINHDRVAERAGLGRRTVYRYYPDRASLMESVWGRVVALAGPGVTFPTREEELLSMLPMVYEGFDRIAPIATVMRATPQGRVARMAQRQRRQESYGAAAADLTRDLPPEDRLLATAMLQVLHTTPWLEMRDHWGLSGTQIAKACGWAMRTLMADLRARKGRPLDED